MALDPGPLVALVAGGAMGALMRWAGPRTRAWRAWLDSRPALRQAALLGVGAVALAGATAVAAHPAWLEEVVAWAQHDAGPAFDVCPAAEGADRPAVALARLLAACPRPPS